ncbi:MAG TPA: phosphatidylglycerophosphatase A [Candidatus Cloacimonas sp.]|jgi:phosphatidylglycerophosphatase A|nr:phosphatidylglycerophosphatase A [Candidatus Cloacimonas acidaminovorans]HQF34796.1 phosphatidylglycerophosphatase A [Candidatus Cloacimonas acidaminovorans]HQI53456.1 phosphatidylglycerophosphatase A [Candidatus Cloacimonas acidaminovorans]HRS61316.1 phosphatidylglycerophosphatase A [Candidatus Cloacimonas sp.]
MTAEKPQKLNIYTFLATLCGIGFIPVMPGTFGSLLAYGIYMLFSGSPFQGKALFYALPALIVLCLIAVFLSTKAEKTLGRDNGSIVIDEFCGYYVSVLFLPHSWLIGLYAFALFRVFDIAKPFPIKKVQELPGGWGVVTDDIIAGIYTNILIQILTKIYPKFFGL